MYVDLTGAALRQGDVVEDVYFPYLFMSDAQVLMPGENAAPNKTDLTTGPPQDGAQALVALRRAPALILTQDCDLDQPSKTPFILVARVQPIADLAKGGYGKAAAKGVKDRAKWLWNGPLNPGRYTYAFYLQGSPDAGFAPSFADLRDIHPVPRTGDAQYLVNKRLLRLSPLAREFLQARVAHYFGRYAVDEAHFLTDEELGALPDNEAEA